jgi:hypothetical protein
MLEGTYFLKLLLNQEYFQIPLMFIAFPFLLVILLKLHFGLLKQLSNSNPASSAFSSSEFANSLSHSCAEVS